VGAVADAADHIRRDSEILAETYKTAQIKAAEVSQYVDIAIQIIKIVDKLKKTV